MRYLLRQMPKKFRIVVLEEAAWQNYKRRKGTKTERRAFYRWRSVFRTLRKFWNIVAATPWSAE